MNTILFDLDGTLIPMDQEQFTKTYFTELLKKVGPLGYTKELLIPTIWKGTGAMIKNDGGRFNRDVFWAHFAEVYGEASLEHISVFDDFYANEFDNARKVVATPCSRRALIDSLKAKGYAIALATNPIFPACAVNTRLRWLELTMDDFCLVTSYENSNYCKPNPKYFEEVLGKLGKSAGDCMMIGNNTLDDMSAMQAGMECYLVTDYLENSIGADTGAYRSGSFEELESFLMALPQAR